MMAPLKTSPAPQVYLYTDGSTYPKNDGTGTGGWGLILKRGENMRVACGYEDGATSNCMETRAVLEGLRLLRRPCQVFLCTDSMYVINGIYALRKDKVFKTNTLLWELLATAVVQHEIIPIKVKGHAGNPLNEWADSVAYNAASGRINNDYYAKDMPKAIKDRAQKRANAAKKRSESMEIG